MTQFAAYENNNPATRKTYPFLLDIQCGLLNDLRTTVVVPLLPASISSAGPIDKLSPLLKMGDEEFIAMTQQLAGIDRKVLGRKVGDLSGYRQEIIAAVDFILTGI